MMLKSLLLVALVAGTSAANQTGTAQKIGWRLQCGHF